MRGGLHRAACCAALIAVLSSCAASPDPPRDSIKILLADDILTLNPNQELEFTTDLVLANVYEPLVGFDENLELRGVLAETWEQPRPELWRFRLRQGVRFHDGTPLTAEVVRAAFECVRQGDDLEASSFLSRGTVLKVIDDHTLDIETTEPRAILASLAVLYVAKPNSSGGSPPFVGTGAYRVREWTPGTRAVLERWDGFREARAEVREASFVPVTDRPSRLARLRDGSADIAYDVAPELLEQPTQGVHFVHRPGLSVFYLGFDLRDEPDNPFRDRRVRQAFHLAIDRKQIVESALRGRGLVATQPVAPLVFGFNADLPSPIHAPERARDLLAQAGWADGLAVRLDYSVHRQRPVEVIRSSLAQVGVQVTLNPLENEELYATAEAGRSALFMAGWDCTSGEASEVYEFVLHTPGEIRGRGNYGGYSNPVVDEIAENNSRILAPLARRERLQEAAEIVMRELPILPLYVEEDTYGVRGPIELRLRADGTIRLDEIRLKPR